MAVVARRPQPPLSRLRRWHRGCGLAVLLVLLLALLSGTLLVYKKPLLRWATAAGQLPDGYTTAALRADLRRLPAHPRVRPGDSFKAPNTDEPYWALRHADGSQTLLQTATLQPLQRGAWLLTALGWTRALHVHLLAGVTGEVVLLVSAVGGLFLCGSGLWLWWPARRGLRWRWVMPVAPRRQWLLHYHRHSGAVVALLLALILFTSAVMLWQKVRGAIASPAAAVAAANPGADGFVLRGEVLSRALDHALREFPDSWPTYISVETASVETAGRAPLLRVRVRLAGELHPNGRSGLWMDTASAAVVRQQRLEGISRGRAC